MFNLFTQEAENALERGLVLPAYDNVIKCSHTFNVLDARGAVGFTERQNLFGKMRELSRKVAEAYYEQRKEMGFPWLGESESAKEEAEFVLPILKEEKADLLFEIGSEELPTTDLDKALEQLEAAFEKWLAENRLNYAELKVEGTPRRQSVLVKDLRTRQDDRSVELKGPPADRAFDADGKPTKVAEGFARSRGLDVSQLEVKEFENGRYVVVQKWKKRQTSMDLLAKSFAGHHC